VIITSSSICVMRKCKGEEREKQAEKILKEIVVKTYKI
jgi:hypothetical protein